MKRIHQKYRLSGLAIAAVILISTVLFSASCGNRNDKASDYTSYLGGYSYDASITAMVYEDLDGEGKGILYREVRDYTNYVTQCPVPVLVYFYTPLHTDYAGTTAQVEQIAEDLQGQLAVVSVNCMVETGISEHYGITTVPEFIILREGLIAERFNSADKGTWTEEVLAEWVAGALSE